MTHPRRIMAAIALAALILGVEPIARAIPTITRVEIIDIAKSGVGSPYVWGGTCWDPSNKSWKGPDCSGYVTKCWQIPDASETTDCVPHYYTTDTYTNSTTHWSNISRDDLIQGDALTYRSGGAGHIVIYDSGDKWGSAEVYEARGSAYGVVHRTKDVESKYVARRRNSIVGGGTTPTDPVVPLMTITARIAGIPQQSNDFCTQGSSAGIFDWFTGQETEVDIDVKNSGDALAKNVQIGLQIGEPYIQVLKWNIYSDYSGSWQLNDTDAMQSISHDNPGPSFALNLDSFSQSETKRIKLRVKALQYSLGATDHPAARAWISHVDGYYDKASFDAPPNNVDNHQQQNGGDLKAWVQTDVLTNEICDGQDNNCDGTIDEGNVCNGGQNQDTGPPLPPDAGVPPGTPDSGGGEPPPSGELPPSWNETDSQVLQGGCSLVRTGSSASTSSVLLLLAGLVLVLARRRR